MYDVIRQVYEERAKMLHIATSDVMPSVKLTALNEARRAGQTLAFTQSMLPDNKPEYPSIIQLGGITMRLQWVRGDEAKYVSESKFDPNLYEYSPTSRIERLERETELSEKALNEIATLEALGMNAIEEVPEAAEELRGDEEDD